MLAMRCNVLLGVRCRSVFFCVLNWCLNICRMSPDVFLCLPVRFSVLLVFKMVSQCVFVCSLFFYVVALHFIVFCCLSELLLRFIVSVVR